MTSPDSRDVASGRLRRESRPGWRMTQALESVRLAFQRHAQRRALAAMEPWQLDDLGLTRAEANREASRRPWAGRAQQT